MLHEIVDPFDTDWVDSQFMSRSAATREPGGSILKDNQRLEVIKITRCKMRAKDILEIEIGLKNIQKRDMPLESRKFILRFLNKLDPQLACKGRLIFTGTDLVKLQKMQMAVLQNQVERSASSNGSGSKEANSPQKDHLGETQGVEHRDSKKKLKMPSQEEAGSTRLGCFSKPVPKPVVDK